MTQQNEFARGYESAYDEIRTAIRDKNHPSMFVCTCPACEVVAELLEGLAHTVGLYLTDDEHGLFLALLRLVEERQDITTWPTFSIDTSPSPILEQKMTPE